MTGASSGIGDAFARRLAAEGTSLVLVARRAERLEALAAELAVPAEVVPADLADAEGVRLVEKRLASTTDPVDLLVNNAGFGTSGPFVESDVEREDEEIRLNVLALVRLTRAALPGLVQRGAGAIVNVASVAGFQASPNNATYGATKAFVLAFTEAVAEEVRGTGVGIQVLAPGFTRTEFQSTADYDTSRLPAAAWQTPEQVVGESLAALAKGKVVCVPGRQNKLLVGSTALLPRVAKRRIAGFVSRRAG